MRTKTASAGSSPLKKIRLPQKKTLMKKEGAVVPGNKTIAEYERALQALLESEEKYRLAFSSIPDVILITDSSARITSITPSVETVLGYKPEELTQTPVDQLKILTPASMELAVKNTLQVLSGKPAPNVVHEFISKDGSIRFGEVTSSPIYKNGEITGMITIARDITERRKMEERLRQSEERYRDIIETIQDGYFEVDLAGKYTFVNDVICQHLQRSRQELIGMDNRQFQTEENATITFRHFQDVFKTGRPEKAFEMEIIRKDGTLQTSEVSISLIRNAQGHPVGFRGISRDVTERRKMEEDLIKSEQKYRAIVENSQEGIFQTSPDNRHITLNQAFAGILGYASPDDAVKNITNISRQVYVNPDEYRKVMDIIRQEGSIKSYETEFYRKDKSRIWVNMSISAVSDNTGKLLYYHGIVEDITPKKKLEQERQNSINSLRKSLGATINAMSATAEARDPYTAGHQRRVADLARAIATEMKLSRDQIDGIRMAGMIHDLGKISVPSEILTKPTKLTSLEMELIRTHAEAGYNILKDIEFPWPIARMVLEHHERIDGSGYPNGLKGDAILLESKIIAIADVVEAISSHRPYRPAFGIEPALSEIAQNSGVLYDAAASEACLKLFRENRYKMPE